MASLDQVIQQMAANGLPQLPHGHPVLDGRIRRFGPGKKAWYVLRELDLRSGRRVITGAFGIWQGTNQNAVPVTLDWEGVSSEERAEAERKQAEFEKRAAEKKVRQAEMAANRARMQIEAAIRGNLAPGDSPYLTRKQVAPEGIYLDADGTVLVPMRRYSKGGAQLVGAQKISPDGGKRFSTGMDRSGPVGLLLGAINQETKLIGIGEGYATSQTVRMGLDFGTPLMVAFDAGGLMAVAVQLRNDFPSAVIVFFADNDDFQQPRFAEFLLKEFKVSTPPDVDGVDRSIKADDGSIVQVRAAWRQDVTGTSYIEADIRAGRFMRILKFENAGLSKARAAATAVGNALVVWPSFTDRGENRWSDFNDLHVQQSLADVKLQVKAAVERAMAGPAGLADNTGADLPPWMDAPTPDSPGPSPAVGMPADLAPPSLDTLLAHFSLVYGTTDVWDGLRKQKLKKSAFHTLVGKETAKAWENDERRRVIAPEALPSLIRGRAVGPGGGGGKLGEMLEQLTLLRGTETVWDGIGQQVMSLGAVRADYTSELTGKWQEHALRKTIEAKNLVFDPTQQADPETHVNIFLGWPLTPKPNADLVLPILALLESLCSAEDNVDECVTWILRWLAYPLQNPGAKMQTALLMFGEKQGTGKSQFFQNVISPIYGEYGTVASQHQLDSTFTAWRSRKLFVLFEEVLSRDDKYSHNGTLKYMITGDKMSINQKNLPERDERNHMNSAFLSNEPQPIPIELEDRRFMVIEARLKQPEAFYQAVADAIDKGGVEAFYHFLLNFPLDGFNEHTKPMMTLAKERVIEFGLNGWMSFHRSWKDGYLAAPYCSCLTEDLYIMYRRWCDKSGEKPITLCKFSGLIASREHKVKRSVAVGVKGKTTRMIFEVKAEGEKRTVEEQIAEFRRQADIRAEGGTQG
jgi:putative DNA primase/helicase